jgi:hypothetical protein
MRAMIEDLSEYPIDLIEKAFIKWRRKSPKIPTPFDIRKLVEKLKGQKMREQGYIRYNEFEGGWKEYKEYLEDFEKVFLADEKKNFRSTCLRDHYSDRVSE